jgi:hypothetical protein
LEVELASLRTFLARKWELQGELEALQHELDNGAVQHTAALHSMRAQFAAERETRRREMEERIAAARRSVAVELHHQLGARAKAQVAENKQLAEELRFQCSEVDKLRAVHAATVQDNKRLLHELRGLSAAGAELVHTSTSLQGVIKDLHSQLHSATATADDPLLMSPVRGDAASDSSIAAAQQQQQQCDSEAQQRALQQHFAHCVSETTAQAVREEATAAALQAELQAVARHNAQTAKLRAELLALTQQCCNAANQPHNDSAAATEAWPLREHRVPLNPSDSDGSSIAQTLLALLNDRTATTTTAALTTAEQQAGRLPLISSAEGRRRQQRTGIPSWDNALAPAIRQVKRSSTRSAAVQTLSYKQQRLCAVAAGSSSSSGGCACCAAKASTASLRTACDADVLIINDSSTAAAAAAIESSSGAKQLHHGTAAHYRAITMRTLHTDVDARLLHNPFPPRRAIISSNKSNSSSRKQSMKGRTAFVSQRGDSLAGTSLAESSIQGSIQGSIGSITTA